MTVTRFSTGAIRDNALATNVSFAASDMELISTIRVGSGGASSVTFSNIPQEYKHLQVRFVVRSDRAATGDESRVRFNGDTGSNYARHYLEGDGATASSGAGTSVTYVTMPGITSANSGSNIFGASVVDVLDYSNGSKFKTVRGVGGMDRNGEGYVSLRSGVWLSTAAVTSVAISAIGNLAQFTRVSLYGIRG